MHLSSGPIIHALIRMESITSKYAKNIMTSEEFEEMHAKVLREQELFKKIKRV